MSNIVFLGYGANGELSYNGPTYTQSSYPQGSSSGANGISFNPDGTVEMYPSGSTAEIQNTGQTGSAPWRWITNGFAGIGAAYEMRAIALSGDITGQYTDWVSLSSARTTWTNFNLTTIMRQGVVRVNIREISNPSNIITFDISIKVFLSRDVAWNAPTTYTQSRTEGAGNYQSGVRIAQNGRVFRTYLTPSGGGGVEVGTWALPLDISQVNPEGLEAKWDLISGSAQSLTWTQDFWALVNTDGSHLVFLSSNSSGDFATSVINIQIRRGTTLLLNQNITLNVGS